MAQESDFLKLKVPTATSAIEIIDTRKRLEHLVNGDVIKLGMSSIKISDSDLLEIANQVPDNVKHIDLRGCTKISVTGIGYLLSGLKPTHTLTWTEYGAVDGILSAPDTLLGHTDWVPVLTGLPNGMIASGSDDHTIRIWDADTKKCIRILNEHTGCVYQLLVLNNNLLVSGSEDKTIRVWNINTGECIKVLNGHTNSVWGLGELQDGKLVSCSWNGSVRIWNIDSGECIKIIGEDIKRNLCCLKVLKNGNIISCSADGTIYIYQSNGVFLKTLKGHHNKVWTCDSLTNGYLVTGSDDKTLRVWDIDSGQCLETIKDVHQGNVRMIMALPNGLLASGCDDKTIRIWDTSSWKCLRTLRQNDAAVWVFDVLSNGLLAVGYQHKSDNIKLWKFPTYEKVALDFLSEISTPCKCLINENSLTLSWQTHIRNDYLEKYASLIRLWIRGISVFLDTDKIIFENISEKSVFHQLFEFCISVHKLNEDRIEIKSLPHDFIDGELPKFIKNVHRQVSEKKPDKNTNNMPFPIKGDTLKLGMSSVRVLDNDLSEVIKQLPDNIKNIDLRGCTHITLHGVARLIAGLTFKHTLSWTDYGVDGITSAPDVLSGHTDWVPMLTALPNGYMASASDDKTIRIWDADTKKCIRILSGHTGCVYPLQVLPNGLLASGSEDTSIRIWNIETGECVKVLNGHTNSVWGLTILKNGNLASCSWDGSVRIWDYTSGVCLVLHKDVVNRNLCNITSLLNGNFVSCSADGVIYVYDCNGELLKKFKGHDGNIWARDVLPNGQFVTGSDDKTVRVWDANTGHCIHTIKDVHEGKVRMVMSLPNDMLATGCDDTTLRIWNTSNWKCINKIHANNGDPIWAFELASNGLLAVGYQAKTDNIKLFRFPTSERKSLEFLSELRYDAKCIISDKSIIFSWPTVITVRKCFLEDFLELIKSWIKGASVSLDNGRIICSDIVDKTVFLNLLELCISILNINKDKIEVKSIPLYINRDILDSTIQKYCLESSSAPCKEETIKSEEVKQPINHEEIKNIIKLIVKKAKECKKDKNIDYGILIELYGTALGLSKIGKFEDLQLEYEKKIINLIKEFFSNKLYKAKNLTIENLEELFNAFKTGLENIRLTSKPQYLRDRGDLVNYFNKNYKELKDLINQIFNTTRNILGYPPPNCSFVPVGLGSMATKTVTAYSDLEYVIIVSRYDDDVKNYFMNFAYLVWLVIMGFGESMIDKSKNFFTKDSLTLIQQYFKKGSRVDSHKNPNDINHLFGLINTAEMFLNNLSRIIIHEPTNHLTSALLTPCDMGSDSDQALYQQYKKEYKSKLRERSYKDTILKLIEVDLLSLWGLIKKLQNMVIKNQVDETVNVKNIILHALHMPRLLLLYCYSCGKDIEYEIKNNFFEYIDRLEEYELITQREHQIYEDTLVKLFIFRLKKQNEHNGAEVNVKLKELQEVFPHPELIEFLEMIHKIGEKLIKELSFRNADVLKERENSIPLPHIRDDIKLAKKETEVIAEPARVAPSFKNSGVVDQKETVKSLEKFGSPVFSSPPRDEAEKKSKKKKKKKKSINSPLSPPADKSTKPNP